ncbi:oxaloacetate decarboxylase [Pendulispora albinea]|uniref:Isocitrate lyase/PEP mutase family protein n=1 Tax=Pendulispora albinea TaxID=2741071 RepID=A0ABZ2LZT5_9BACT
MNEKTGPRSLREKLREQPGEPRLIVAPGAYDCITARAVQHAGAAAVYMTGAGTAAALGYPDYGLLTLTEMAENAGRIAASVDLPVIADADTGYGNELNTVRTVREFERRGVAAIHLEDQAFPKKCGHLDDKVLVSMDDFVAKIRAAVAARSDPHFMLIARTDARAVLGFEQAIHRANAALAAGADMAFVEAPETVEEIRAIPRLVRGPCMLNMVWGGKTPDMPFSEVESAGYRLAILPLMLIGAAVAACDRALEAMKEHGRHPSLGDTTVRQTFSRFGADEWDHVRDALREDALRSEEPIPPTERKV